MCCKLLIRSAALCSNKSSSQCTQEVFIPIQKMLNCRVYGQGTVIMSPGKMTSLFSMPLAAARVSASLPKSAATAGIILVGSLPGRD